MNSKEIKTCILQMSQLWTNYKAPQTNEEMMLAIGTWLRLFAAAPFEEVSRTIDEFAEEGNEFAPQIGQIHARIKANKAKQLKGISEIEAAYRNNARVLAKILGVDPPAGTVEDIKNWLQEVRNEQPREGR